MKSHEMQRCIIVMYVQKAVVVTIGAQVSQLILADKATMCRN